MEGNSMKVQIRWADIDANRHLRHSVYYDYGAMLRMSFLTSNNLSLKNIEEFQIGPVIFREEAVFRKEIVFEDQILIDVVLLKATSDFSRWSLQHRFYKSDNQIAATLTIDGAWIDLIKRKLAMPNDTIISAFSKFPRSEDFQWILRNK
jgi:acyl-CoA thioester hydrolase